MHSPYKHDFQAAATEAGNESAFDAELGILRDVLRLLPTGITVQDESGDFLLVNDAAAALLTVACLAIGAWTVADRASYLASIWPRHRAELGIRGGPG